MSLETEITAALRTAIGPIAGSNPPAWRVYAVRFPELGDSPAVPMLRYTIISAVPNSDICGDDSGETDDVRTQVDVIHSSAAAARALRDAVATQMKDLATPTRRVNSFEDYDTDTKLFRCVLEFISYPSS